LGARLECLAGLSRRAGTSSEVDFRERCHGEIDCAAEDRALDATERSHRDCAGSQEKCWNLNVL